MIEIKVAKYKSVGSKKAKRLVAELQVSNCVSIDKTEATIAMHPICYFRNRVPDVLVDWLNLSSVVYTIDRTFDRHKYSVDGWSRDFNVSFKVLCPEVFNVVAPAFSSMLSFLTGDFWNCTFEKVDNMPCIKYSDSTILNDITQVNLFSGGLDSLIGAIDYMEQNPNGKLFLASHYDHFMTGPKADQYNILTHLPRVYKGRYLNIGAIHICPQLSNELTCRSRSLMFMSIALLVASYANAPIVVPENGPVSLNFPLSHSRRAACSTRTTHPIFLKKISDILRLQGLNIPISNPYEFMTKGEMVENCANLDLLLQLVPYSNSCGKRSQHQFMLDNHNATHCGRCMPCMYRKASLLGREDKSTYGIRMSTLFRQRDKDLSNDFFAMLNYLKRELTDEDIRKELRIAGLSKLDNFESYVDLVKRTREELKALVKEEASQDILSYLDLEI